jgi:hypothetical protein
LPGYPYPLTTASNIKEVTCIQEKDIQKNEQLTQFVMPELIRAYQAEIHNSPKNAQESNDESTKPENENENNTPQQQN